MVREVGDLHVRIAATLEKHPEALAAWRSFEDGFMYVVFTFSSPVVLTIDRLQRLPPFNEAI
jgi:hypothetical protein